MDKYTEATLLICGLFGLVMWAGGASWSVITALTAALFMIGRLIVLVDRG